MKDKKWKINKAPDNFQEDYECAELDNCYGCFWSDKGQCIREVLTEDDIKEIKEKKDENRN